MIAAPIRVPGVEPPARAAPPMGADTESELRAAGYSDEKIAALRRAGTHDTTPPRKTLRGMNFTAPER